MNIESELRYVTDDISRLERRLQQSLDAPLDSRLCDGDVAHRFRLVLRQQLHRCVCREAELLAMREAAA